MSDFPDTRKWEAWTTLREAEAVANRLWREREGEGRPGAAPAGARLRNLNLVAVAQGRPEAERVEAVFETLQARQPARLILLWERLGESDGAGEPESAADGGSAGSGAPAGGGLGSSPPVRVRLACAPAYERRQSCSEVFLIPALPEDAPRLHVLVEPLLLPDLPVVLWAPQEPDCTTQDFRRLTQVAKRVVLDSAGFAHAVAGLKRMSRLMGEEGAPAFGDLSWGRLTPWRELVADLFQDPERRPLLQRIRKVSVDYGSEAVPSLLVREAGLPGPPALARGLLLLGWLAGRLGWSPAADAWQEKGDGVALGMRPPAGTGDTAGIEVSMAPHRCSRGMYGGLESVTLEAEAAGGGRVVLTIKRSPETGICTSRLSLEGAEVDVRTVDMHAWEEPALLAEELVYSGRDALFEESLALAVQLGGLPGAEGLWV